MTRLLSLLFHDVYARDPVESGFPGPAADRYKLSTSDFERQLSGLAEARRDAPVLIDGRRPVPEGGQGFAITVDDGGVSFFTEVAPRLEARGWRAHCLVTTGCIGRRGFLDRAQIRDLGRRGHVIGSHSVSHPPRFHGLGRKDMVREWRESRATLEDVLGEKVAVASVPGGGYSQAVAAAAAEAGLGALFTSEPERRLQVVEGCLVLGRFTVRRGSDDDFSLRLGRLQASALLRQWVVWNGKKVAKGMLGSAYPRLALGMARRGEEST